MGDETRMKNKTSESDFKIAMQNLTQTYGGSRFPENRVSIFWQWAKQTDLLRFKKTIDVAIANCAAAPMLDKLQQLYSELKPFGESNLNTPPGSPESPVCSDCNDTGTISAIAIDSPFTAPFAFRCNKCNAEQKVWHKIKKWHDAKYGCDYLPLLKGEAVSSAQKRASQIKSATQTGEKNHPNLNV